ncbi:pimeloyl-ACP methyl ester esterase BioH [Alteromonas sp. a30]|uniref:pimeloyl-ACP methyl ester esterase BioH n=1 Tax=Alteromonas sp. a30 TaxID=2730917 RepID=UPI002281CAC4|nr:pimeloyl-ACP methyl ester esterase BioH [Alteromonas sp. a30]MCY7295633.1 pimeloyl-ACP methyl ester esterase BioH [Alteromonas sp. a30]
MTQTKQQTLECRVVGDGPDLVLLHGWGLNSGVYDKMLHDLSAHFRVTLIDLPGYGVNNHVLPEHYDLPSIANMVAQVIPERCAILGWSFGGLVAQRLALDLPDQVNKLILVATTPKFAAEKEEEWHGMLPEVLDLFKTQLQGTYSKTLDRFMAMQALGSESAKSDIVIIKESVSAYPEPHTSALEAGLSILKSTDLRHELMQLAIPTLRIYGRLDSIVPEKAVPHIESHHPESRSLIIRKASHAPFISHQDEFLEAVRTHLLA